MTRLKEMKTYVAAIAMLNASCASNHANPSDDGIVLDVSFRFPSISSFVDVVVFEVITVSENKKKSGK